MTDYKHFIDIDKISVSDLRGILDKAVELKTSKATKILDGIQLALIFEKPSTRTRVSFEVAINQLGGLAIILDTQHSQLARGETIADAARVLSRYVDIMMLRTYRHGAVQELAEHATIPVINGLTDYSHPCQLMADILTYEEKKGSIQGATIAWVGDCNNVAQSWIHAAKQFDFTLNIACPEKQACKNADLDNVQCFNKPEEAVKDVDCVLTDTWASMGDKDIEEKKKALAPYQVNEALMSLAKGDAIFMHCLPAHRGEEVTDGVIDGPQSIVWDEAENRLHAQKAILLWCLGEI